MGDAATPPARHRLLTGVPVACGKRPPARWRRGHPSTAPAKSPRLQARWRRICRTGRTAKAHRLVKLGWKVPGGLQHDTGASPQPKAPRCNW